MVATPPPLEAFEIDEAEEGLEDPVGSQAGSDAAPAAVPEAPAEPVEPAEPAEPEHSEEPLEAALEAAHSPVMSDEEDEVPDFSKKENLDLWLGKISKPLTLRYDAFGHGSNATIKPAMRATLSFHGVRDEETFYDVAAPTPTKANEILAELAGLKIIGESRVAKHHVPASKLAKIFTDLHATHDPETNGTSESDSLTARDASIFALKFLKLLCFELPLFFMADLCTMESLRKSFVSGRYTVGHVDDVKCALREDRMGAAKDKTQPQPAMNLGLDSHGKLVTTQVQTDIGMTKWVRCLELYWYAILFVGNATHHCENSEGVQVPWMSMSTFLVIWGAIKQYVIEAPPNLRINYVTARGAELEFRREIFMHIAKMKCSFDVAFKEHGYTQLRRLFQYQTNVVVNKPVIDGSGAPNPKPPKPPKKVKGPKKEKGDKEKKEKGGGKGHPKSGYERRHDDQWGDKRGYGPHRYGDDRPLDRPKRY